MPTVGLPVVASMPSGPAQPIMSAVTSPVADPRSAVAGDWATTPLPTMAVAASARAAALRDAFMVLLRSERPVADGLLTDWSMSGDGATASS